MENITQHRFENGRPRPRRYHQARWDEPIIFELSTPGERGILVPPAEEDIKGAAGDVLARLPAGMRRRQAPALPELSQNRVLRHYLRLSQQNLGADLNIDIGQGTCTMKYNPKVNEQLGRQPKMTELHPRQHESTVTGILDIMTRMEAILKDVSGMDRVSFQPRGGSSAIYANAAIIRAYHESRGEAGQRDEIITTMFSHPSDAACAKLCGFKVITLYPGEQGYPSMDALAAVLSERTAGMMITNPEDTGIFNPDIARMVDMVHQVGGLCAYDQANANGLLGITRARDAGFDLCHFNLHKTFATPHACGGPAVGAMGVTEALAPFLPYPVVEASADGPRLAEAGALSIGKVGAWTGCASIVMRAYAWVMNLGADGLKAVSEMAVLNNNYLMKRLLELPGIEVPYTGNGPRIEQVRYSWQKLYEETGITTEQLGLRLADFGQHYWTSHHPYVVPQPATLEPTEAYSMKDIDEYVDTLAHVVDEAYRQPELVASAPHNCPIHQINDECLDDPERWAVTWRGYQRKLAGRQA
ncbi:aminomethyl-transferring glycine dehydrogenase subunit GcvPB [Oceanimonas baumannii]|uniref:glycine dehydrogenase (aminomethyl-transferring) n=1 Tax=Oceanimonas baumannii TaxID=129578 RepID=A0A235CFR3_9GAMM|nr:aminomethyl-transferring glycine dehydrogenase subunit GcvPB [Oceanimonas baumannii]OYD23286.1 glycine dehydrogenase subunit 2 [Oceanimonas baumannii]TDW58570.1 glycine dehydrogenase subunit 2 [Oceanimonas baumannii]